MSDKTKRIKVTKDGPYLVTDSISVCRDRISADKEGNCEDWVCGEEYDAKSMSEDGYYALCRCGHSKNKPFCDSQHEEHEFDNNVVADRKPYVEAADIYEGDAIDLLDDVRYCASAGFCHRYDDVWHMTMGSGDENPSYEQKVIDETNKCPSGRLTVRKNGQLIEPELEMEIGVTEDAPRNIKGPLWVKGGIIIEDDNNIEYENRNRVTLCRCGESKNMPFCDSSHVECEHMKGLD